MAATVPLRKLALGFVASVGALTEPDVVARNRLRLLGAFATSVLLRPVDPATRLNHVGGSRVMPGARARNILTPSSEMIVPAMTSSIASSPVIIPPCSSWERKGRDGHARHSGMRVRAMVRRTSRPLAHFRADRIIRSVQVSPLLWRNTPGPALERPRECSRLGKVERGGDLTERQLRV